MFYFRLDAVHRDVDKEPEIDPHKILADREVKLFARRLGETLEPALQALISLGAHLPNLDKDDHELAATHKHLFEELSGDNLQSVLKRMLDGLSLP